MSAGVLFDGHAYGTAPSTEDDVAALSEDDLRKAYEGRIRPDEMTIYAVGGIDADILRNALNKHLGNWKANRSASIDVDVNEGAVPAPQPRIIVIDMPGAIQSNIIAARAIDRPYQDGDDAFMFANMIYGGTFTSRINANIPRRQGLELRCPFGRG